MVNVYKFYSEGDWEAIYVDGERVESNHQGRTSVLKHINDTEIDTAKSTRVNLPEGEFEYPKSLQDILDNDNYDLSESDLE